jgi:hypothetical protein
MDANKTRPALPFWAIVPNLESSTGYLGAVCKNTTPVESAYTICRAAVRIALILLTFSALAKLLTV